MVLCCVRDKDIEYAVLTFSVKSFCANCRSFSLILNSRSGKQFCRVPSICSNCWDTGTFLLACASFDDIERTLQFWKKYTEIHRKQPPNLQKWRLKQASWSSPALTRMKIWFGQRTHVLQRTVPLPTTIWHLNWNQTFRLSEATQIKRQWKLRVKKYEDQNSVESKKDEM